MQLEPFDDPSGTDAFLGMLGLDASLSSNQSIALEITQSLGGLPLALNQMCGFIVNQRLALKDFLPLYQRNQAKIDKRKIDASDYDHTLSTVWETALGRLTGNAATLQRLLAFFQPDRVDESVLVESAQELAGDDENHELAFFLDDME